MQDFTGAEAGTGLAVYLRMDAPILHETTRVEGLGLHHAIFVEFDAVVELDESQGEIWVDAASLPGFGEGGVLHGSLAAVNRTRGFMDIAYASAVVYADAYMAAGRVDVAEGETPAGVQRCHPIGPLGHRAARSLLVAATPGGRSAARSPHRTP